jgi:hypothetical protein
MKVLKFNVVSVKEHYKHKQLNAGYDLVDHGPEK